LTFLIFWSISIKFYDPVTQEEFMVRNQEKIDFWISDLNQEAIIKYIQQIKGILDTGKNQSAFD